MEINRTMQDLGRINVFSRIIGAIDGTYIPIKDPAVEEPVYVN